MRLYFVQKLLNYEMDFKLFSLLLVVTTTGRAFADLPDTINSCTTQNDSSVNILFTVPPNFGIHTVSLF
jgi:hypothetical protein